MFLCADQSSVNETYNGGFVKFLVLTQVVTYKILAMRFPAFLSRKLLVRGRTRNSD